MNETWNSFTPAEYLDISAKDAPAVVQVHVA